MLETNLSKENDVDENDSKQAVWPPGSADTVCPARL